MKIEPLRHPRPVWPALIVAPSLMLGAQLLMYALVTPSCDTQTRLWMHVVAALALASTLGMTWLAWSRRHSRDADGWSAADHDRREAIGLFTAAIATGVGLLFSLVVLAMWLGAWVLSPCWY